MSDRLAKTLKLIFRILVTVILLVGVLRTVDLAQLSAVLRKARWQYLFISLALTVFAYWLQAIKMRLILLKQDCPVATGRLFGVSAITCLYGLILPGVLSSGVKWYLLKRQTGKGSNILSGMFYNQMTEMVTVLIFGLSALVISNPSGRWQVQAACGIAFLIIFLFGALFLNKRFGNWCKDWLNFAARPLPDRLHEKIESFFEQVTIFQSVGGGFHFAMFAFNAVMTSIGAAVFIYAAKAAAIEVSVAVIAWQFVVIYLLGKLPISVANLGVREITLIGALAMYGVGAPSALLMSAMIFSCTILMAAIGAVYQLLPMTTDNSDR